MSWKSFHLVRRLKSTLVGAVITGILLFIDLKYDLDFSERVVDFFHSIEQWQIDEIALCSLAILLGMAADLALLIHRMIEKRRLHAARMEVMEKALLKTQHIVNNYLNEMLLFKIELEKRDSIPKVELERFGNAIYHAANELEKIERLEDLYIDLDEPDDASDPRIHGEPA